MEAPERQARWRALVRLFPAATLPWDMVFDPATYRMIFGVDFLQSIFLNGKSRRAAALLQGLAPAALERLSQIAQINEARTGDFFKAVAICYITLPLAFIALLSEAAPDEVRSFATQYTGSVAYLVLGLIVTPIVYFLGHWRAKQIAWTIAVFRAGALSPPEPIRAGRVQSAWSRAPEGPRP